MAKTSFTRKSRGTAAMVAALVSALFLSACGGSSAGTLNNKDKPETLIIAVPSAPSTLDVRKSIENALNVTIAGNVVEGLTYFDTTTKEVKPLLATDWKQVDDLHWEFTIRDGVKFHNGKALTASDVVQSFIYARDSKSTTYTASFSTIKDAAVKGENVVVLTTSAVDPVLPSKVRYLWVLPGDITEQEATTKPIGTGPYSLDSYAAGRSLKVARYKDYWGEASGDFDSAEFIVRPETNVRVDALRAGETHIALSIGQEQAATVPKLVTTPGVDVGGFLLNTVGQTSGSIMEDKRVREAVNMAIDRQTIIDSLYGGQAILPKGQYNPPFMAGTAQDIDDWPYDPEAARRLIKESGNEGKTVRIRLRTDVWPKASDLTQITAQYLEDVGLKTQIEVVDEAKYIEGYRGHAAGADSPYDMLLAFHGNNFLDSSMRTATYISSRAAGGGTFLVGDAKLDELVKKALVESDMKKRNEFMAEAWRLGRDQAYWATVVVPNVLAGTADNVRWEPTPDGFLALKSVQWD